MSSHIGLTDFLRKISVARFAIIATSCLLITYTLFQDTIEVRTSPLWRIDGYKIYLRSIPITFIGTVLPLLYLVWLYRKIKKRLALTKEQLSIHKAVMIELHGNAGIVLFFILLFTPLYLLTEAFLTLSVVPLTLPLCGLLGVCICYWLLRQMQVVNKLTVLSLFFLLILLTKYIDWNPRKPFVRDLYKIKAGMTVTEVKKVMGKYTDKPMFSSDDDPGPVYNQDDSMVYRHSQRAAYNADWGMIKIHEGRVETVKFSPD